MKLCKYIGRKKGWYADGELERQRDIGIEI